MKKMRIRSLSRWMLLLLAPVLAVGISLFIGRYEISATGIVEAILKGMFGISTGATEATVAVVTHVRLPRALVAAFVGGSLAAAGAAFQSLFQNPLVSPGLLGVTNGAGFGAAMSILFLPAAFVITPAAFFFGLLAVLLSHAVARIWGQVSTIMLVLAGTIVSSIFASLLAFMKYIADPGRELASIVFWTLGSLASIDQSLIPWSVVTMGIGIAFLLRCAWPLNLISMGEREALSMGISIVRTRNLVIIGATLATAGAVSIAGSIGWIGLIVPHIARVLFGNDNRKLIPASVSLGAVFLVFIDLLARTLTGSEIPLGLLTALIGGPFFIGLMKKHKGSGFQ